MRRRTALQALLTAFALPAVAPRVAQAAETLAPGDGATDTSTALARVAGYVWALGTEHMRPASSAVEVEAGALAAWRDLRRLHDQARGPRTPHLRADALQTSARAAALIGEVRYDAGDERAARTWYARAASDADRAVEAADLIGNRYARGTAVGVSATVRALYAKKIMTVNPPEAERVVMSGWVLLAREEGPRCTAHALVPAVLARIRALRGNVSGARTALAQAEQFLDLPDYPDKDQVEQSILRYHPRSHIYSTADMMASSGDVVRARARMQAYLNGPGRNPVMNTAVLGLGEAMCRLRVDGPIEAAEHATAVLTGLAPQHRSMVVLGRADQLARRLENAQRSAAAVRDLREVVNTELARAHNA